MTKKHRKPSTKKTTLIWLSTIALLIMGGLFAFLSTRIVEGQPNHTTPPSSQKNPEQKKESPIISDGYTSDDFESLDYNFHIKFPTEDDPILATTENYENGHPVPILMSMVTTNEDKSIYSVSTLIYPKVTGVKGNERTIMENALRRSAQRSSGTIVTLDSNISIQGYPAIFAHIQTSMYGYATPDIYTIKVAKKNIVYDVSASGVSKEEFDVFFGSFELP